MSNLKWHFIYWCHVVFRWIRWPFCRWVRQGSKTLEEVVAGFMRDPDMRKIIETERESYR